MVAIYPEHSFTHFESPLPLNSGIAEQPTQPILGCVIENYPIASHALIHEPIMSKEFQANSNLGIRIEQVSPSIDLVVYKQLDPNNPIAKGYLALLEQGGSREELANYFTNNFKEPIWKKALRTVGIDKSTAPVTKLKNAENSSLSISQIQRLYFDKYGQMTIIGTDAEGKITIASLNFDAPTTIREENGRLYLSHHNQHVATLTLSESSQNQEAMLMLRNLIGVAALTEQPKGWLMPSANSITNKDDLRRLSVESSKSNTTIPTTLIYEQDGWQLQANIHVPLGIPLQQIISLQKYAGVDSAVVTIASDDIASTIFLDDFIGEIEQIPGKPYSSFYKIIVPISMITIDSHKIKFDDTQIIETKILPPKTIWEIPKPPIYRGNLPKPHEYATFHSLHETRRAKMTARRS